MRYSEKIIQWPGVRGRTGGKWFTSVDCLQFPHPLVVMVESDFQLVVM